MLPTPLAFAWMFWRRYRWAHRAVLGYLLVAVTLSAVLPSHVSLDVAPFVAALEHATGKQPKVFGKPAEAFFGAASHQLGLTRNEIVMVGDDINADIGGALAAGLRAALVQTGKYRAVDLEGPIKPDVVLPSVASLPKWWRTAGAGPVNSAS